MLIRPFHADRDIKHINEFFRKRETSSILSSDLPQHGLIAFEAGAPIAAGFLRLVEGNLAMLDSYVTDPSVDPVLRDSALDRLTTKLVKIAKANNIKLLMAFSSDINTLHRTQRHGFTTLPHVFTMLSFSGENT